MSLRENIAETEEQIAALRKERDRKKSLLLAELIASSGLKAGEIVGVKRNPNKVQVVRFLLEWDELSEQLVLAFSYRPIGKNGKPDMRVNPSNLHTLKIFALEQKENT